MSKKLVLISVFMLFASFSFAQQRELNMENNRKMGSHPIFEKLNLTEQQKKEIKQINLNTEESVNPIKCEIENEQIQLKKELAGSPKLEALITISEKISKLENRVKIERIKQWYSVYKELDENQKIIWVESFRFNSERPEMPKRPMRQ